MLPIGQLQMQGQRPAQASYLHGSIFLEQEERMITADKKTKKRFINFKILANIEDTNQNVQLTKACRNLFVIIYVLSTVYIPIENKKK
jgi:hypothetical protein